MKKVLLGVAMAMSCVFVSAQVGIGTDVPKATLDVTAVNKTGTTTTAEGVLIPRVDRQKAQSMLNVEISTLIYVNSITTGTQVGTAVNIDTIGFYYYNGTAWVKLPDTAQILSSSYWNAQASNANPRAENKEGDDVNGSTSKAGIDLVKVDIYQEGKVGIGYNNEFGIDFETNKTQKQLEVGGDFRTVYTKDAGTPTSRYYGIETNSKYGDTGFETTGNLFYSSMTKNVADLIDFTKSGEGNLIVQDDSGIGLISREGGGNTLVASSFDLKKFGIQAYAVEDFTGVGFNKMTAFIFDTSGFLAADFNKPNVQFGLNFTSGKLYIGERDTSDYTFPMTRPLINTANPIDGTSANTKDNQILMFKKAQNGLVWEDLPSSTPKFFYMPSVVLPTVPTDARVVDASNTSYTYDSGTKVYTVDLYALYSNQFTAPIKSSSAATLTEFVKVATAYDYFVTYIDETVFEKATIGLTADGKLTYKIIDNSIIKNGSFMNIVLKVK